jgi:hypothetical protein
MALLEDGIALKKEGTPGFLGQILLHSQCEIAFHQKLGQERKA